MRIAVWNRHWATAGGGERYAGALAQVLAAEHNVELLTPEPIDWAGLAEKLGLDLSRARPRLVEDAGYGSLTEATHGYDLLVNCSYMSSEASGARHGLYVCLFPTSFDHDLSPAKRALGRLLRGVAGDGTARLEWGRGFHFPERTRFHGYRWTSGEASLLVRAPDAERVPVRLAFGGGRPAAAGEAAVEVETAGRVVAATTVGRNRRSRAVRFDVAGRGPGEPVAVRIRSSTFSPRALLGTSDPRELGAQLRSVQLGSGLGALLRARFPGLTAPPVSLDFLESYDRVVSISRFTEEWVRRLWDRESDVLYPPVPQLEAGEKEPIVLSVGRFFGREAGHSKKQLELVRAFRRLVRSGMGGWEYHLAGGSSPEHAAYLEEVRREAAGLPVRFHVDASGAELRDLYRRASVFWHAAGLGEDEERHPHRLEHFGIATVEAMSAGCVPVVLGRAGQREIVEDGVSGLLFETVDELVERTRQLAGDPELRRRLAAGAQERAAAFGPDRFAAEARALVAATLQG